MTATTATNHIQVPGTLVIDLNKAINMQGLYSLIQNAYPSDQNLTVVGISIPVLNIGCKEFGIIDPISDIKSAISRLYDYLMKAYLKPIYEILMKLFDILKSFGLGILDLTIPVLDLHISDLFADNLYDKLKAKLLDLYNNSKDKLIALLKLLDIPYPLFKDFNSPELEIEEIVKRVMSSIWTFFFKLVDKIKTSYQAALAVYDALTTPTVFPPPLSTIWKKAVDALLAEIEAFLLRMPTIQEIEDTILAYARKLYNKFEVTYEELIKAIKSIQLPIFKNPLDWLLPIDPHLNRPNIDFAKLVSDIKIWMNNFIGQIIVKFIQAISAILKIFGLSFVIPTINIPVTLCAVAS
jgi:hypothetical protein